MLCEKGKSTASRSRCPPMSPQRFSWVLRSRVYVFFVQSTPGEPFSVSWPLLIWSVFSNTARYVYCQTLCLTRQLLLHLGSLQIKISFGCHHWKLFVGSSRLRSTCLRTTPTSTVTLMAGCYMLAFRSWRRLSAIRRTRMDLFPIGAQRKSKVFLSSQPLTHGSTLQRAFNVHCH